VRHVEYRAWNKTSSMMLYDYVSQGQYGELHVIEFHSSVYSDARCPDLILMQYVGLKDVNNKKMFEGDVVDIFDGTTRPEPIRGVIEWNERVTGFEAECPGKGYGLYLHAKGLGMPPDRTIRVVGNIYNDPGLIDQQPTEQPPDEIRGRKIRA